MRLVIAGSRSIVDPLLLERSMHEASGKGLVPTAVLSGAADGVDHMGEQWADRRGIPVERFPARWDDLEAPGAVLRRDRHGRLYNARAGHDRNAEMARACDGGVILWDERSSGTRDMIALLGRLGKPVHLVRGSFRAIPDTFSPHTQRFLFDDVL